MGAVDETRKAIQDFLAPEIRTLTARMESLVNEQTLLRQDLAAVEARLRDAVDGVESRLQAEVGRTRADVLASEARVTAAIDRLRADMPLLVCNAVLEQMLAEKQRIIEDFQRQAH